MTDKPGASKSTSLKFVTSHKRTSSSLNLVDCHTIFTIPGTKETPFRRQICLFNIVVKLDHSRFIHFFKKVKV